MEFSFPPQSLLGIFLTTANEATVILTSRRRTCPLTTGLLPPPGCTCAPQAIQQLWLPTATTLSLADPMAVCFPPEQDEKAQPLFSVCSFLSFPWEVTSR